jgi:hypothetical protein
LAVTNVHSSRRGHNWLGREDILHIASLFSGRRRDEWIGKGAIITGE